MDTPTRVLSDVIVWGKYARFWGELGRRETFDEVVARNRQMVVDHLSLPRFASKDPLPALMPAIDEAYKLVQERKVLPSMRALQFAGEPIHRDQNRIYNCAFMHANRPAFFRELLFLLLGGTGVGYSVQWQHVYSLPPLRMPRGWQRHVVQDSVVGWANALDALVMAFFAGRPFPDFDYREVRPEGTVLKTSGGKAPGPAPLKKALDQIFDIFLGATKYQGKLAPIDVHDIACYAAECVLSGGIRRSAMIALFSPDDEAMLTAKSGDWYDHEPQRAYANNSAVLLRDADEHLFDEVFAALQASGSGEPGVFWTYDRELGTNPCAEISLHDRQFCNLTTINASSVVDQDDLNQRARAAAILGTIQASFTDLHYLDYGWVEQTEKEALVGVSLTGIASGKVLELDLAEAADVATSANAWVAELLGINAAARVTTVKPEGTSSLVMASSSGIHPWHDPYYIRRVRFNKTEAIAQYLMQALPYRQEHVPHRPWPVEDVVGKPSEIVLSVPQKAPEGALTRDEGALALLDRVMDVTVRWIWPGHRSGKNNNNVSTTVNVRPEEWEQVRAWMYRNRHSYTGIAVLPYDGGTYVQAPFETIDQATYEKLADLFDHIDVTLIDETSDYTNLAGEAACAGGACELPWT